MNEEYYRNRCIELDKKLDRVIDSHTKLEDKIKKLQQENKQLKDRINKAIEYIEDKGHHYDSYFGEGYYSLEEDAQKELLEILKGNDYEKENKEIDT